MANKHAGRSSDSNRVHQLYKTFLDPVREGWQDAEELIIVVSGPLGQIPFAVLPVRLVVLEKEKEILFKNHRRIPYLIRSHAVTRSPAVSSFIALRKYSHTKSSRKAFAGFGNPVFNPSKHSESIPEDAKKIASRGLKLHVRGIRVSNSGSLDDSGLLSSQLKDLMELPDTQKEIISIAESLNANRLDSVFLGRDASETRLKTMNLADRRIIAFASHALLPGDLNGLNQPAIALSSPTGKSHHEDGLLTMEEIFGLKLNAD